MGTPISAGAGVRKPVRPRPNRSSSLWRGCLFACAAGWNKGWDDTDGSTTPEDQRQTPAVLQGSRGGTHTIIDAGRALASGVSLDPINWATILNSYQSTNGYISAAVLFRLNATGASGTGRAIFSKSVDYGFSGWRIQVEGADRFRFEIGFGGGKDNVDWITTQSLTRSFMVVGTYDREALRIYGDGALRGGPKTLAGSLSDSSADVRLFAPSTDGTPANANVAMVAAWNRALTPSDVARLYSDPYTMWRTDLHKEFMFGNVGGARTYQTFFLNFG
jgi:hypothetical protein